MRRRYLTPGQESRLRDIVAAPTGTLRGDTAALPGTLVRCAERGLVAVGSMTDGHRERWVVRITDRGREVLAGDGWYYTDD